MLAARPGPAAGRARSAWRRPGRPGRGAAPGPRGLAASAAVSSYGGSRTTRVARGVAGAGRVAQPGRGPRSARPSPGPPGGCVRGWRGSPSTAAASRSTKVAWAAPRDSASIPAAPLPANRSRTLAPRRSGSRIAKRVCLTRSPSGRVPAPGASSRMPARRAGDDPAGVRHAARRHVPLAGSAATRWRSQPRSSSAARTRLAAGRSARRRRAAPRRGLAPGRRDRGAPVPGATRPEAAGSRSGRAPARCPPCAARSPSRPARTRRWYSTTARRRASAVSSSVSDTRTQNDSTVPRPTRPRSWWSWASPNRSAPSMTIIVAAGTSTPTSTTVVPTSTSSSPSRKRVISASRSAGFIRPWTIPTRSGASSAVSRTASVSAATAPSPRRRPPRSAARRRTSMAERRLGADLVPRARRARRAA